MENRCYNCSRALSSGWTCISDGDCPEFDPGPSTEETAKVIKRLEENVPGVKFEPLDVDGGEPLIRFDWNGEDDGEPMRLFKD